MFRLMIMLVITCAWSTSLNAAKLPLYTVEAGDILRVSVWKEPDLQLDVLVRPDGRFSMPLIGEMEATGKTVEMLQYEIAKRLDNLVPDAVVTVAISQLSGNKIYVLGKVNRPGEYAVNRYVDVMQVLSMAGGTTTFADLDDIIILRRGDNGQRAISFDYDEVGKGKQLQQNIILHSGDVVVVP